MSSELAAVKSEIKAWERAFRESEGHEPSVEEIKELPDIAAKYKLYKRLTKLGKTKQTATSSTPSLLLLNPRSVQTTAPLSSFNPFSPEKKKTPKKHFSGSGKPLPDIFASRASANIFATPTKAKPAASGSKKTTPPPRDPSPDPFPLIEVAPANEVPTSALTRARKRLRGEAVSPSPNKDKRRKTNNLHLINRTEDVEMEDVQENASFLFDSPVKAPQGPGRSFKLLFDETEADKQQLKPKPPARTKSGLFGERTAVLSDIRPAKHDDLFDQRSAMTVVKKKRIMTPGSSDGEETDIHKELPQSARSLVLIPPSPPPAGESNSGPGYGKYNKYNSNGKGKEKDTRQSIDYELEEPENTIKLRMVHSSRVQVSSLDTFQDDDDDPIFGSHRFARGLRPFDEEVDGHNTDSDAEGNHEKSTFSISVPDSLLHVLAISDCAPKPATNDTETQVVRGLFTGRRQTRYDPTKGGEVWGVGEQENDQDEFFANLKAEQDEDDWESEGVPWEVGEM